MIRFRQNKEPKEFHGAAGPNVEGGIERHYVTLGQVIAYLVSIAAVWELGVTYFGIPSYLIPRFSEVIASIARNPTYFIFNAAVTAQETMLGLVLGFTAGFALGIFLHYGGAFARAISPIIIASQVFPKEALAPLFLVFFGFGLLPKIIISALICFFPVVVNTARGLAATPRGFDRLMYVVGADEWSTFWRCRLPFAVPFILASLRVCATLSLVGAVVGEFVGANAGLGHVIRAASADIGTDRIYAALIILGGFGASLYGMTIFIEQKFLRKYARTG